MDTNKMREQFEAWYALEHPSRIKTLRWEPEYQSYKQQFDACMFSSWQASREASAAEIDQLKAENEALRKDAERYRFIKALPHATPEHMLDAAMAKEAGQ